MQIILSNNKINTHINRYIKNTKKSRWGIKNPNDSLFLYTSTTTTSTATLKSDEGESPTKSKQH